MNYSPLFGLVAATHTPFDANGELNLNAVEAQAAHLSKNQIATVFIGGSTGESHSLAFSERQKLATRWLEVAPNTELEVIVHVGSNCLREAKQLAKQADELGARAISMVAPSYFKPATLDALLACCADVAASAPATPFYYYDIPALTGVKFPMPSFSARAIETIPTFAGLKFTNFDLGEFQLCQSVAQGTDLMWGVDEFYLAALAMGARGAIGSTFNFAPNLAHQITNGFDDGDFESARRAQLQLVQLIQVLANYGYLPAAKALMEMLGVPVGPPRLPYLALDDTQKKNLRSDLEHLGFFDK